MRWKRGGVSDNVEDRRGRRARRLPRLPFPLPLPGRSGGAGGRVDRGGAGLPLGGGKLSLTGLLLILVLLYFTGGLEGLSPGGDGGVGPGTQVALPDRFPGGGSPGGGFPGSVASGPDRRSAEADDPVEFISFVLDDVQETWTRTLRGYRDAKLVLYTDTVESGCGYGQAAAGPFYCPADEKVYIDLGFYRELHTRFGAPGDFAQAYVLAHEIGHHVQKVTGIEPRVRRAQESRSDLRNALSVRMELQADCLAGVWAHSTEQRGLLESGDVEEGLNAAAAVGDDRIQKMARGRVHPESFTHGSSQQRVDWFRRGYASGDPEACDTFEGAL